MSRKSTAASATSNNATHAETDGKGNVIDTNGEVIDGPDATERLLERADVPELRTADADLPVLGWDNSAEVSGGDLTSLGFAKLVRGFKFRGFVTGTKTVDSDFDSPAGKKKQEVYCLKGTARCPMQGADSGGFGEVKGTLTIPIYARLKEALDVNAELERKLGHSIPVEITYEGQNPNRDKGGGQTRAGSHIFRVVRISAVAANRPPAAR